MHENKAAKENQCASFNRRTVQFQKQEMNTLVARISVRCKSETDYVSHAVGFDNGRDKWNGMHFYFLSVSMLKMYAIFKSVDHPQVQVMVSENFFFVLFRVLMLFSKFQTLLFCTWVSSALKIAWVKPKTHTFPLVYFFIANSINQMRAL